LPSLFDASANRFRVSRSDTQRQPIIISTGREMCVTVCHSRCVVLFCCCLVVTSPSIILDISLGPNCDALYSAPLKLLSSGLEIFQKPSKNQTTRSNSGMDSPTFATFRYVRIALNYFAESGSESSQPFRPIAVWSSLSWQPINKSSRLNLLDSKANLSFWFARLLGISRPARCAPTVAGLIRT
jgi:hypothetical protein